MGWITDYWKKNNNISDGHRYPCILLLLFDLTGEHVISCENTEAEPVFANFTSVAHAYGGYMSQLIKYKITGQLDRGFSPDEQTAYTVIHYG